MAQLTVGDLEVLGNESVVMLHSHEGYFIEIMTREAWKLPCAWALLE